MGVRVRVSHPQPSLSCSSLCSCPLSPWPWLPPCRRVRMLLQPPYVHDATGDVAEAYVHEEIPAVEDDSAAEAYVHEEIAAEAYVHDATGDVAEGYVHVEPVAPAVVPAVAPVTYAAYPYGGVYAGHPVTYPYAAYPYAVYHTGCVNNVGSVVPCA